MLPFAEVGKDEAGTTHLMHNLSPSCDGHVNSTGTGAGCEWRPGKYSQAGGQNYGLKALMLLTVSFQQQPSLSFDPVLDALAQLLDGAVHGLLSGNRQQLAMSPEKGVKEDCRPR